MLLLMMIIMMINDNDDLHLHTFFIFCISYKNFCHDLFFIKGPSYNKNRMFMWLLAKPLPVADRIVLENVKKWSYMSRVSILI